MLRSGENRKSPPQQRTSAAEESSSSAATAADRNGNASANERAAVMISSSAVGSSTLLASRDHMDHENRKRAAQSHELAAAGTAGESSEPLGHDEEDGDHEGEEIMSIKGDIFDHVDIMDIPKYVRAHDTSLTFPEKVSTIARALESSAATRKYDTGTHSSHKTEHMFAPHSCCLVICCFFMLCSPRSSAQHDMQQ
jgi:hypothetical protein